MTLKQGCTVLLVQTAMGLILIPTSRHPVDEDVEEAIEGGGHGRGGQGEPSTSTGGTTGTLHTRGRGRGRGRGWGRGKGVGQNKKVADAPVLDVKKLTEKDGGVPSTIPFTPRRHPPGMFLPQSIDPNSPEALFKLYFDATIVNQICKTSNEYAETQEEKKPVMYSYYKDMTSEDLYKMVGIIIHLDYRRVPRYRFAWSPSSLCYDPFVVQVMSRNRFEGLMSFLHIDTEDRYW